MACSAPEPRADGVPAALRSARRSARRADAERRRTAASSRTAARSRSRRPQVRALRDGSLARAVRRPRVPRPHHRRARAQRRPRVPRPLRRRCCPAATRVPFGDLDALQRELRRGDVAAFVVEPIQGKGVFVAPDDYLRDAAELCHRHGALLAIDEVQTGLGRTGTFFAFEQWDVEPDLVTRRQGAVGRLRARGRGDREERASSRRCSTRWTAPSCTARPSARTCSR